MSQKKVTIQRPKPVTPESWIKDAPAAAPQIETRKLSFEVPIELHRRIKISCAQRDRQISEVLRELLEKAFPGTGRP